MAKPQPAKKETSIATLKDVIFMYSSVSRAVKQLNKDEKPFTIPKEHPLADLEQHSYEIKILITEKRFKALKKAYAGAKNLPNAKDWTKEDLLEAYDFLDPKDLDDYMVLLKFSQGAIRYTNKAKTDAKETFPVRQIGFKKARTEDANGNVIDHDTILGNGTKGHFQFRPVENDFGVYLYPHLLCITDLVEYVASGVEEDYDSLGLEDDEQDEADLESAGQAAAEEAAAEEEDVAPTGGMF